MTITCIGLLGSLGVATAPGVLTFLDSFEVSDHGNVSGFLSRFKLQNKGGPVEPNEPQNWGADTCGSNYLQFRR